MGAAAMRSLTASTGPALDADLWGPVLDLVRPVVVSLGIALAVFIGIRMLAVYAFGANFDVQRWIDRIKVGRAARRVLGSILAIASGIAADLHFAPSLFTAPIQAGPGVLVGSAAVAVGLACLVTKRGGKARKKLLALTAVVTLVLCGGCAAGNVIGEAV
jgi:hypothetical protein